MRSLRTERLELWTRSLAVEHAILHDWVHRSGRSSLDDAYHVSFDGAISVREFYGLRKRITVFRRKILSLALAMELPGYAEAANGLGFPSVRGLSFPADNLTQAIKSFYQLRLHYQRLFGRKLMATTNIRGRLFSLKGMQIKIGVAEDVNHGKA